MIKQEGGFALVESLVVLFVVLGLIYFPVQRWDVWQTKIEVAYFFKEFEMHALSAQQVAISSSKRTRIYITMADPVIEIMSFLPDGSKNDYQLTMPESLIPTKNATIYYRASTGNLDVVTYANFENIKTKEVVTYQFYLGSGRFEAKRK